MKHEEVAKSTGKSRSYITNLLRILTLSPQVKNLLREEKISFGHARALIGFNDQFNLAKKVINEKLNVRDIENLIRKSKNNKINIKDVKISSNKDPNIVDYEKYLSLKLGYKVEIKDKDGKGLLIVRYKDLEQLDAIVELFNS